MTRRFNYTGRERLTSKEFVAKVLTDDPLIVSIKLDLSNMPLEPNAEVYVEAYTRTITDRINCGTVENLDIPNRNDLSKLTSQGSVLFRVKVVQQKTGLILASGNRLKLTGEGVDNNRKSLLNVYLSPELGEEIWKVDVSTTSPPVLYLNSKIAGIEKKLSEDPFTCGAILVPALRQVLLVLVDDLDGGDWQSDWLKFVKNTHPDTDVDKAIANDEHEDWANEIVKTFVDKHGFVKKCVENENGDI